jgi:hypothetical protein
VGIDTLYGGGPGASGAASGAEPVGTEQLALTSLRSRPAMAQMGQSGQTLAPLDGSRLIGRVFETGKTGGDSMASQPIPAWKYPLRAATDVVVILLGFLLATWPLILLLVLLRVIL